MTDPRPEWVEEVRRVLADEGADSEGGWHSWRCFDLIRYPESCDCTENAARLALAAVIDQIKAEALRDAANELRRLDDGRTGGYYEAGRHIIRRIDARADQIAGAS